MIRQLTIGILALIALAIPIQSYSQDLPQSPQERIQELVMATERHEVMVIDNGMFGGRCTGSVLTRTKILTAKHCISAQPELYVEGIEVERYQTDQKLDIALLELSEPIMHKDPVRVASRNARRGDELFGIGYSRAAGFGIYGKFLYRLGTDSYAVMEVHQGCSGAGIFNANTELVGILWGKGKGGYGIYTDISKVKKFLSDVGHPID